MSFIDEHVGALVTELSDDVVALYVLTFELQQGIVKIDDSSRNFADFATRVAEQLLLHEGIEVGSWADVEGGAIFEPWKTSTKESLKRIHDYLQSLDRPPNPTDNIWFRSSRSGQHKLVRPRLRLESLRKMFHLSDEDEPKGG